MRKIVFSPKFGRALRRYVKRNPELRNRIENVIQQMELDVFAPSLGTHPLRGRLEGFRLVLAVMIVVLSLALTLRRSFLSILVLMMRFIDD